MVNNWTAISIESDNFWWMIVALFAAYRVMVWKLSNHLSPFVKIVVCAWAFMFTASGANHGWFAISRHFSESDEPFSLMMYEWRWLVIMLTVFMFNWGMVSFLQLIDEFSDGKKYALFLLSYTASRLMGIY